MSMSLEDFFKESEEAQVPKKKKPKKEKKERKHSLGLKEFIKASFSLDANVDLTDEVTVLYRKNEVIKNIIAVSNVLFIIFSFVGITKSNFIVTIAFMLLVTGLSWTINRMLKVKADDMNHQVLIMYLQSIFIFVKAVVLYIKTYLGFVTIGDDLTLTESEFSITQAAYFLIFYAVVVVFLYQDTVLLRRSYIWTFLVMTVINITLLHPELYLHGNSYEEFFGFLLSQENHVGADIILRTFVMLMFFGVLYVSVEIVNNTNKKRKAEFTKRVGVENTFKDVVSSVFTAVKVYNLDLDSLEMEVYSRKVQSVALELAKAYNLDSTSMLEVEENSKIHTEWLKELNLDGIKEINEYNSETVQMKTELAKNLMIRLQTSKKCEDIVYHVFEANATPKFISKIKPDRLDIVSNIIMLAEVYVILRNDRSYKKALNHQRSLELILASMTPFFMDDVILRFKKFNTEISNAYEIC